MYIIPADKAGKTAIQHMIKTFKNKKAKTTKKHLNYKGNA